jgi:SAM-dependent methyltransferase
MAAPRIGSDQSSERSSTGREFAMTVARRGRDLIVRSLGRHTNNPHLTRYAMYRSIADVVDIHPRNVLSISGSSGLCDILEWPADVRVDADFPAVSIVDLPYDDGAFDAVVADQVLEHVEGNPQRAIDESARVLAPGGTLIHTTCFVNPRHYGPKDLWRFTPVGLDLLATSAGLEVVTADGWGSFSALIACRVGFRHMPVPDATWHPVHKLATASDPDWLISTWLIARKPVARTLST